MALTIALACNKVLRKTFLKPEKIGLIPPGGYSAKRRYSKKALLWLLHMERTDRCHIRHARNGREYRPPELQRGRLLCRDSNHLWIPGMLLSRLQVSAVPRRVVDGEWWDAGRTIWTDAGEYRALNECWLYCQSAVGMQVWRSCRRFAKTSHSQTRANEYSRRSVWGSNRGHASALLNKRVRNLFSTATWVYPYICKYFKFPIGHPIIHVGDTCADIEACLKMKGLMKCKIVPAKDLYHPVLPYRWDKKLLFCLCRTCVLEHNDKSECQHLSDDERCL